MSSFQCAPRRGVATVANSSSRWAAGSQLTSCSPNWRPAGLGSTSPPSATVASWWPRQIPRVGTPSAAASRISSLTAGSHGERRVVVGAHGAAHHDERGVPLEGRREVVPDVGAAHVEVDAHPLAHQVDRVVVLVLDDQDRVTHAPTVVGQPHRVSAPPAGRRGAWAGRRWTGGRVGSTSRSTSPAASRSRRASARARGVTPGQRRTQLGEPPRLLELGQHRHRPLPQQRLASRRPAHATGERGRDATRVGDQVLRPQGMAVALVAPHVAQHDQRVQRSPERVAGHAQLALELDEPGTAALVQQGQGGRAQRWWKRSTSSAVDIENNLV